MNFLPISSAALAAEAPFDRSATAAAQALTSAARTISTQLEQGRIVTVEQLLCEGAYAAFLAGDLAAHDRIVREHLSGLMQRVDAVLLAQASMARVVETISESDRPVPVLSSPRSAMEKLAAVVSGKAMRAKS